MPTRTASGKRASMLSLVMPLVLGLVLVLGGAEACGRTADIPDSDSTSGPQETGDGATNADSSHEGGSDGASKSDGDVIDASGDAQPLACAECKPDFCGCGTCSAAQIVCTKNPKPCPLGCATSCDVSQFACACASDRCVHVPPSSGDVACYATPDCPPGHCCEIGNALVGKCKIGNGC